MAVKGRFCFTEFGEAPITIWLTYESRTKFTVKLCVLSKHPEKHSSLSIKTAILWIKVFPETCG